MKHSKNTRLGLIVILATGSTMIAASLTGCGELPRDIADETVTASPLKAGAGPAAGTKISSKAGDKSGTRDAPWLSKYVPSSCDTIYTATTNRVGPACGTQGAFATRCDVGDYCASASGKRCKIRRTCGCEWDYHAAAAASGPPCGTGLGGVHTQCQPGDYCKNSYQRLCVYRSPCGCDALYHAATSNYGPQCGMVGQFHAQCLPGDYCESSNSRRCRQRITCGSGAIYHAFWGGGGPSCGTTQNGFPATCFPGDTCISSSSRRCRYH